jgi:hypothetical protein
VRLLLELRRFEAGEAAPALPGLADAAAELGLQPWSPGVQQIRISEDEFAEVTFYDAAELEVHGEAVTPSLAEPVWRLAKAGGLTILPPRGRIPAILPDSLQAAELPPYLAGPPVFCISAQHLVDLLESSGGEADEPDEPMTRSEWISSGLRRLLRQ